MLNVIPITELKQNLAKVVKRVNQTGDPVYVLQRSKITSVILDAGHYEALEKALEDVLDGKVILSRKKEKRVSASAVAKKIGL